MRKIASYPKIAFDEQHNLLVSNEDGIATDDIKPSLQFLFHSLLVFLGTRTCRGDGRGQSGHETFRVCVNEMILKLHELLMCPSNISDERSTKSRQVGLKRLAQRLPPETERPRYLGIEPDNRILRVRPFDPSHRKDDIILRQRIGRSVSLGVQGQ